MGTDYYEILGVSKDADKITIKKAFKKLALKYHPDRAPEDKKEEYEKKFKEINEAVSVLGDDKKRQQYDQFGNADYSSGGFEGFDFSDIMSQFRSSSFGDFDNIFDHIFGGGRRNRASKGEDLVQEVTITLKEAYKGVKKKIHLNKLSNCPKCKGQGATEFKQCSHCHGSGYVKQTQRTPFGIFQQTGPCPYCHGQGKLPQNSCPECHGEGIIREKKDIDVKIPPGVDNNMKLRVPGEGQAGYNKGPNGDLYLIIYVQEDKFFERKGNNLHLTVPISYTQAVLGDKVEIPTMDGNVNLTIPPNTDSETIFRMKDRGMPDINGREKGDQMVKVKIEVPKKVTKKQKELIEKMNEESPLKSFVKKIFG
jgi:molecular chaperone DnaJ